MAEQWIEARDALAVLGDRYVICERLHAGLIESRARLITRDKERAENVFVPQTLWWARGHEALDQNWEAGDFSTWLDDKIELSAFGVQLGLSGVLNAIPAEQRGAVAVQFSVAGSANWISADRAIALIAPVALRPAKSAETRIIEAARLGFVVARAVEALAAGRGFDNWSWREREWNIPAWFWEMYTGSESGSRSFEQDTARGRGRGPHGAYMQLNGIHFFRSDLERQFGLSPPVHEQADLSKAEARLDKPTKNQGGRPPAAFADEMMCAIWALIYQGDLKPKRQAEVEKALLDWATAHNYELGVTAAREKARRIFTTISKEDENPSGL